MEDNKSFGKDRFDDIKAGGALERLSERAQGSRTSVIIVAVVALFVLAFVIGLAVTMIRGGASGAPEVPKVDIR